MARLVIKFGGTSVGSAQALSQAARIAADLHAAGHEVVVVTSAMSGVTDLLLTAATAASRSQLSRFLEVASAIRAKHALAIETLFGAGQTRSSVAALVDQRIGDLQRLAEALAVLGEATPRALDAIASLGERLSIHLLSGAIREAGVAATAVDATEIIRTDAEFQSAVPDTVETRRLCQARLLPMLTARTVPVVTGFVGATASGAVTTLGRGGSDYSAAIIGAALDADEVWIFTDVDGVLTADPRVVPDARTLDQVSYLEMSELAYFGAKVLHPKTTLPALERGIPLRIKNTFNPSHPGTLVMATAEGRANGTHLRGVTSISKQSLITVAGRGMLGFPGIAARAMTAVAQAGTSVPLISQSSSEQSICFVVPQWAEARVLQDLQAGLDHELTRNDVERVFATPGIEVVTVVGSAILTTPGVLGQILTAVGGAGINVLAMAMGSSVCSISLAIEAAHAPEAVRRIHTLIQA